MIMQIIKRKRRKTKRKENDILKKIITIVLIVGVISLVGIASVKAYAHHNSDYNCSNCYDNNLVKHNCSIILMKIMMVYVIIVLIKVLK